MYATPQTEALHIASDDGDAIPIVAHWLGSWRVSVHRRAMNAAELARSNDRVAPTWARTLGGAPPVLRVQDAARPRQR
jgi:hypothetical protein